MREKCSNCGTSIDVSGLEIYGGYDLYCKTCGRTWRKLIIHFSTLFNFVFVPEVPKNFSTCQFSVKLEDYEFYLQR